MNKGHDSIVLFGSNTLGRAVSQHKGPTVMSCEACSAQLRSAGKSLNLDFVVWRIRLYFSKFSQNSDYWVSWSRREHRGALSKSPPEYHNGLKNWLTRQNRRISIFQLLSTLRKRIKTYAIEWRECDAAPLLSRTHRRRIPLFMMSTDLARDLNTSRDRQDQQALS